MTASSLIMQVTILMLIMLSCKRRPNISKIVEKYVNKWHFTNLNTLIFDSQTVNNNKSGCIYYGSFRKDREVSFRKYLQGKVIASTHQKKS